MSTHLHRIPGTRAPLIVAIVSGAAAALMVALGIAVISAGF